MNRRKFLAGCASGAALIGATTSAQSTPRALPLLPLNDLTQSQPDRLTLTLGAHRHDFGTGSPSQTFGINQAYLGPVLRAKQGQTLPFTVINTLDDVTTLHWHGLHIPGEVDGGPHQEIQPGHSWAPDVPLTQRASMNWFHAHTHGKTAQQTYTGLAGVLLIEDDASLSADLPQTYGVDDFTLVLQDKSFDGAGRMTYALTGEVIENGFFGETLVVNGTLAPVQQVTHRGLVRFRLLNACNARFLTLSMTNGPLTVIASDGGFLAKPIETASLVMSPGERYEILVDMSSSTTADLMVDFADEAEDGGFFASLFGRTHKLTAVSLVQDPTRPGFSGSMPQALANLDAPQRTDAMRTRQFQLDMGEDSAELAALAAAWGNVCGDGAMGINGQPMNMDRIDEQLRTGQTEIWRISADEQRHPFHVHGCSFRILTQDGGAPPAYAQGWKDMVHVQEGWSEILVRFDHKASAHAPYMYHCHILEHEDCGMMGQFTVT